VRILLYQLFTELTHGDSGLTRRLKTSSSFFKIALLEPAPSLADLTAAPTFCILHSFFSNVSIHPTLKKNPAPGAGRRAMQNSQADACPVSVQRYLDLFSHS
jgi:hypothetical protein